MNAAAVELAGILKLRMLHMVNINGPRIQASKILCRIKKETEAGHIAARQYVSSSRGGVSSVKRQATSFRRQATSCDKKDKRQEGRVMIVLLRTAAGDPAVFENGNGSLWDQLNASPPRSWRQVHRKNVQRGCDLELPGLWPIFIKQKGTSNGKEK